MTVYDNMAFGLKLRKVADVKRDKNGKPVLDENGKEIPVMRKYTKKEIDEKVQAAAKILAIEEYLMFLIFQPDLSISVEVEVLNKSRLVLSMKLMEEPKTKKLSRKQDYNIAQFKKVFSHYL